MNRIVVGITGASGAIYGIRILEELARMGVESHLVISKVGMVTIRDETGRSPDDVRKLASFCHEDEDLAASISSGTFRTDGMIVAPCSMKTLAGIACGYSQGLVGRAAAVAIKEQRKLLLLVRESPLDAISLENMLKLARLGVLIMPTVTSFYTKPKTLDDVIDQTVGRALDYFDVRTDIAKSWK